MVATVYTEGWRRQAVALSSVSPWTLPSRAMSTPRRDPPLSERDPDIARLIHEEERRESDKIWRIPSENYASRAVLEATGWVLTNKYSEGYAGKRYYEGQQVIDQVEELAISRLKALFGAEHVNVQPYSGSPANLAVYLAFCQPHDPIMGLGPAVGRSPDPRLERQHHGQVLRQPRLWRDPGSTTPAPSSSACSRRYRQQGRHRPVHEGRRPARRRRDQRRRRGRGRKLSLNVEDEACDPKTAAAGAEQARQRGRRRSVGGYCSSATLPTLGIFGKAHIPMIIPAANSADLLAEQRDNVFLINGTGIQQAEAAAKFIKSQGSKGVALIDDNTSTRPTSPSAPRSTSDCSATGPPPASRSPPGKRTTPPPSTPCWTRRPTSSTGPATTRRADCSSSSSRRPATRARSWWRTGPSTANSSRSPAGRTRRACSPR